MFYFNLIIPSYFGIDKEWHAQNGQFFHEIPLSGQWNFHMGTDMNPTYSSCCFSLQVGLYSASK